jgi:hypothetical protein
MLLIESIESIQDFNTRLYNLDNQIAALQVKAFNRKVRAANRKTIAACNLRSKAALAAAIIEAMKIISL